jgi:cleavage and polyadenylation specificity factor subunit 2
MMVEEAKARSSFFKQTKSFPMFPCREDKVIWDEYGEHIRHEDYQQKELLEAVPMEADNVAEKTEEPAPAVTPTKCVSQKMVLPIRCSLSFIDFEGLSDGESVKRILSIVKPRQLILVHGSPEATNHLREFALSALGLAKGKLFTPRVGDCTDASTESHIYQVKLTDSLMNSVQFSQARDSELAWVDGSVHLSTAVPTGFKGQDSTGSQKGEAMVTPVLDALPHNQVKGHPSVFINPPRLADFKQVLNKAGLQAEFSGGVLVCNKCVAVRKGEGGKIRLEGTVCDEYYQVRKLLYEQFAII